MKIDYGWLDGGNSTNSSSFSVLPCGYRDLDGFFYNAALGGYGWSSSPNGPYAWYRELHYYFDFVQRGNYYPQLGFSVLCVRDAE